MSRIGKQQIALSKKVNVEINGQKILVEGPKGKLSRVLPSLIKCNFNEDERILYLEKVQETKLAQALYGLSRTLVSNMVIGVSDGFKKRLQITGVGYRAQVQGKELILNMGYSHPVRMLPPSSIIVECETPTLIVISGIEKDIVGEFAAKVRSVRQPEPYKGKGISYEGEIIRRKAGKTGK